MTSGGDVKQSGNDETQPNNGAGETNDKELEEARKEIDRLKRELHAEKQAKNRLLTNVRLPDDDFSNPVKLVENFNELNVLVQKFAKVKGSHVEINVPAAKRVIKQYHMHHYKYPESEFKELLMAALRRKTLEFVGEAIKNPPDDLPEKQVFVKTTALCNALSSFAKSRTPKDEGQDALPTKIRQQVYSYAAEHCFGENDPYIDKIAEKLLQELAQYRKFTDNQRDGSMRAMAANIVRRYISLFKFSLLAQPVELTVDWLNLKKKWFDERRMVSIGAVHKRPGVGICAFPVIEDGRYGVYCKAEVITYETPYY